MCTVSSAYTGVPGQQQAPLDVRTSEGQAERPAHHPDILTMAPQGPPRITTQVYPSKYTTVYFKLGTLRRVSTYVQHVWGIIGHVTAEAGNTVGTDGAPPHLYLNGITKQICDCNTSSLFSAWN